MSAASRSGGDVLERILASTRREIEQRKHVRTEAELAATIEGHHPHAGRLRDALASARIGVIAEFKRRSPSAGALREGAEVREIVSAYERGGACAVSVLTEGAHFEGSLDDLRAARASSTLPLLRKDFIIDRYQLYEACGVGADAVLLIVAALDDAELASLIAEARALGLDVLVEVHSAAELERAGAAGADVIGVNNRDLRDFSVDLETTLSLMSEMPAGALVVSESGIDSPRALEALERAGVAAVLVGEALMRASDPETALRAFIERPETLMEPDGTL